MSEMLQSTAKNRVICLQILSALLMVFYLIGYSGVIGGIVTILLALVQYFVAAKLSEMQRQSSVSTSDIPYI